MACSGTAFYITFGFNYSHFILPPQAWIIIMEVTGVAEREA
jgi:hypothetical protein